ncbi:hypothetical protein [Pradoshia sp.]
MKKVWCVYSVLLLLAVVISGCNVSEASGGSTVKFSENSEYVNVFEDLGLGAVLDFRTPLTFGKMVSAMKRLHWN